MPTATLDDCNAALTVDPHNCDCLVLRVKCLWQLAPSRFAKLLVACNRFLDCADGKELHHQRPTAEAEIHQNYDTVLLTRGVALWYRDCVEEALDDFERVSSDIDKLQLLDILSPLDSALTALFRIIAACSQQKSNVQKRRLARAQSLHHLFSAERDAVAAAETEPHSRYPASSSFSGPSFFFFFFVLLFVLVIFHLFVCFGLYVLFFFAFFTTLLFLFLIIIVCSRIFFFVLLFLIPFFFLFCVRPRGSGP